MSVISNIHTATVYDAKQSRAFDGQRLVVTIAKKDKDGNYGQHLQQTMCTSIPVLETSDIDFSTPIVQTACIEYFRTIQNAIIAERIKSGQKSVQTHELGQDAIINYLVSESVGDKWDASRVAQWFMDNIALAFTEKLLEKGVSDADIDKKIEVTKAKFAECLSSKAKIPTMVAEKLTQVLALCEDDCGSDVIYKKFYAKLNPPTIAEALDFGF